MAPKKVVQDIVPGERKTIRNIPVRVVSDTPVAVKKPRSRPVVKTEVFQGIEEDEVVPPPPLERSMRRGGSSAGKKTLITFIIILICCAIVGVALSFMYSKAVVTITPKITELSVNGTFTAHKESTSSTLIYEVVNVSGVDHETVEAKAGPLIQSKAKGTLTLYNNYGTTPQKIIAGTRVSDDEGHIYRTSTTVTIPGKKVVSGKTVPGSVSVIITADVAGDSYNALASESDDYTIVAYKGTPKYEGFYGRLKTNLTGGFSGSKMTVAPEAEKSAIETGKEKLKADLLIQLKNAVPEGYVLYDSAYLESFTPSASSMKSSTTADIAINGSLNGIIFKKDILVKNIAGKEIQKFPSDTYEVKGIEDLQFTILNGKDISIKKGTPVIFTLKGSSSIVGTFSESELKEKLRGIGLNESNKVFAQYGAISNAYALLTPFWMRHFPNTVERIILEYKSE